VTAEAVSWRVVCSETEGAKLRLRSPTKLMVGNNWPRTRSILSRAANSVNIAEMTFGLLLAASVSASSRVAGSTGRSRGCTSLPGG
jgi:hypothetical protein